MSNRITIELCAEDRARLDRLAEALERGACKECATPEVKPEVVTEPETAEAPVEEPTAETESIPQVSRAELRAKVIELSAKGLKEQTKEIVQAYAPTVASVPDDKITECYQKLATLEG